MKCQEWVELWPSKFARCVLDEHGEDVDHLGEVVTRYSRPKTQQNYDRWKTRQQLKERGASPT